jgi:uncharacterized protein (TIGR00369 family)
MAEDAGKVPDLSKMLPSGLDNTLGVRIVSASVTEVVAELEVTPSHHQPMGIVHGGLYCTLAETVCSIGASLAAMAYGRVIVGVDNHTSFLKAVRSGTLRATARPLATGRSTQLWEASITDAAGTLVATGRVRLLCLDREQKLAGQAAGKLSGG